jgi:hypothetical protein
MYTLSRDILSLSYSVRVLSGYNENDGGEEEAMIS